MASKIVFLTRSPCFPRYAGFDASLKEINTSIEALASKISEDTARRIAEQEVSISEITEQVRGESAESAHRY